MLPSKRAIKSFAYDATHIVTQPILCSRQRFMVYCSHIISVFLVVPILTMWLSREPFTYRWFQCKARFTVPDSKVHGPTWRPSGADRTHVGPMLAPWTLLSGVLCRIIADLNCSVCDIMLRYNQSIQYKALLAQNMLTYEKVNDGNTKFSFASILFIQWYILKHLYKRYAVFFFEPIIYTGVSYMCVRMQPIICLNQWTQF